MKTMSTADRKTVRALGLHLARVKSVETYDDGLDFFARELRQQTTAWTGHEDWLGAAFAKGGAVALLTGGFDIMHRIGGPGAGTQWLRFALEEAVKVLRPKADIDAFLVGPKFQDGRTAGAKVAPRRPRTAAEARAQVDAVHCALEAAAEQLRAVGLGAAAGAVGDIAAQMPALRRQARAT